MRILFYYESLNLGGQQTQTYQLVRRLADKGHALTWVSLYGDDLRPVVERHARVARIQVQLKKRDYFKRPWRVVRVVRQLTAIARASGAEVIISGSGLGSLVSGITARRLAIPHFRLVGCSLIQVERTLYRLYRVIGIDCLIDGYLGWPAVFAELGAKGVPPAKFIELNNAVDGDIFRPLSSADRDAARRSLGIAEHELVLGWVGRIAENMQVGNTVKLGAELRRRGFTAFRLLFVGGGPWERELREILRREGLSDFAIFTGWVPMSEVNRLLNAMDVVPLLEEDPQGGSIVREAMASGRVALSVDGVSGTQRRFMNPGCAVLVPPVNFIQAAATIVQELASNAARRQEIGENAREYALRHMSFDQQVEILLRALAARAAT